MTASVRSLRPEGVVWATSLPASHLGDDFAHPGERSVAMRSISLPKDALLVVGGMPGAGKSTLCRRLFPGLEVLSCEGVKEQMEGAGEEVSLGFAASEAMRRWQKGASQPGPLVLEITALNSRMRMRIKHVAKRSGRPLHWVFLDVDPAVCRSRQAERGAAIDDDTMAMYEMLWGEAKADLCDDDGLGLQILYLDASASVCVLDQKAIDSLQEISFT
jgi:predicted kinase